MKIILTGSLGHISKPLTEELVQKGHEVTVISSKFEKQKQIEALGARAAIGSLEDVHFLTSTFMGADAIYTMVPPADFRNPQVDLMKHYLQIVGNYAEAIKQSGVKRIVHLSSIGAHLDKGTGIILSHNYGEKILNKLADVAITFMRPTAFYYNLYMFIDSIKNTHQIASNYGYGGDDIIPWVSPQDIAGAIAKEIVKSQTGKMIVYVASEELTCNEAAHILGEAVGIPDLKWATLSDAQMLAGLTSFGVQPGIANDLVEMNARMHSGELFKDYYLHKPVMGSVKMKDFAKEFAVVFNQ